jgi:translation initiation factor 2 alpha subunit (eIF-2alpha)
MRAVRYFVWTNLKGIIYLWEARSRRVDNIKDYVKEIAS